MSFPKGNLSMITTQQTFNSPDNDDFILSEEITVSPLAYEGNIDWLLCRNASSGDTFVMATAGNEASVFTSLSC